MLTPNSEGRLVGSMSGRIMLLLAEHSLIPHGGCKLRKHEATYTKWGDNLRDEGEAELVLQIGLKLTRRMWRQTLTGTFAFTRKMYHPPNEVT